MGTASLGSYYNLVVDATFKDTNNHYDCNSDWYQVYYDGINTAYICGDHVEVVRSYSVDNVTPSTACEKKMSEAGFPSSYWGGLCYLNAKYPKWQFNALNTDADWSYSVERESSCGKSYIQTETEEYMDRSCKNTYGWSSSWKNASQKAVAYYMDPRNFLSERYIFQFEYLKYDSNLTNFYPDSVKGIIGHADFYDYHKDLGNDLGSIITTAGREADVSPTFIAVRVLQELGAGKSEYNLYSGIYPGYEGYYNFFNWGVTDTCATSSGPTICGLTTAKNLGWQGLTEAFKGGADQISAGYIKKGQYTRYLQKYNVTPTNKNSMYTHQYMTNIKAPSVESSTTYNSYNKQKLLDKAFAFYIPVYNKMDAAINNSSAGGTGENPDVNASDLPISTIVTSSGYKYEKGYVSGIELGTEVATLKGKIESVAGFNQVTIMDANSKTVTSGTVATGYKVLISNSKTKENLEIVIKGDTSGDGIINALDLLQVQKSILETYNLQGPYKKAGDTSNDGVVNALDLLQVQKHILETYTIEQ